MLDHAASPKRLRRIAESLDRLYLGTVSAELEAVRRRAAAAVSDYLLPRGASGDDDIVVAVIGPAGSGKSSVVNALAGREISDAGPLRPTTTEPVAWAGGPVPATLDAVRARLPGSLVEGPPPPPDGVVVIDTPPPEVVDADGVSHAVRVVDVADAAIFVVAASRYADARSIALLEHAAGRGIPIVVVVNRLSGPPDADRRVLADVAATLAGRRLIARPDPELVVSLPEQPGAGVVLAGELVAPVAKELGALADSQSRPAVVAAAVAGSLARLRSDLVLIRAGVIDHEVRRVELLDPMRAVYRSEARALIGAVNSGRFAELADGSLVPVLASAATRHAARASRQTAERWASGATGVLARVADPSGPDTLTMAAARDRLEFWLDDLGDLPERVAGRPVRSSRRRRRLTGALRRAVLDPSFRPEPPIRRTLERMPGLVEAARHSLALEIDGILASDGIRFAEAVGPAPAAGVLAALSFPGEGR